MNEKQVELNELMAAFDKIPYTVTDMESVSFLSLLFSFLSL